MMPFLQRSAIGIDLAQELTVIEVFAREGDHDAGSSGSPARRRSANDSWIRGSLAIRGVSPRSCGKCPPASALRESQSSDAETSSRFQESTGQE